MAEFRWSIDGGVTWTYEDQPLPHVLPVTAEQTPIVQALGVPVVAGDYTDDYATPGIDPPPQEVGLVAPVNLYTAAQASFADVAGMDGRGNWSVTENVLSQTSGNGSTNDVRLAFDTPLTAGHAHLATWQTHPGTTGSYKPQFGGAGSAAGVSFAGAEDAPKFQYLPAAEATGAFTRFGFNPTTDDLDTEFTDVSVFDLSATDPNHVDCLVFACVGDSNMGNAVSEFATADNLEIEFDGRVWYVPCLRVSPNAFDKTGSQRHVPQPCMEPCQAATGAARMSPVMAIGSELADWAAAQSKPVLLLSLSEAGSGLNGTQDWRKASSVATTGGRMYTEMLLMWAAVQALGPNHHLAGLLVSLGANDTTGADYNDVWVPHAQQFVADVRADLARPDLPVAWLTVGEHYEPIPGDNRGERMIAAQESLDQDSGSPNAIPGLRVVRPPVGNALNGATDPHFTASGMQANGRALGQALLQVLPTADSAPVSEYSALDADNVVLVGASLLDRGDDTPEQSAYLNAAFANMGYTGTLDNRPTGGDRFPETQTRLDGMIADYAGQEDATFVLMHRSGNDVTHTRPMDAAIASAFRADLDAITTKLKGAGFAHLGASTISKRFYETAPTVEAGVPSTDINGSGPYNTDCVVPWIAAEMPDHADQIDAYDWIENTRWLVSTNDGIHLWTAWEHIFAEWLLWQNARIYADHRADVAGRSFVFHASRFDTAGATALTGTANPVPKLRTRNVDTSGQVAPYLVAEFDGAVLPSNSGGGGASATVADVRLQPFTNDRMHCSVGVNVAAHDHITWRLSGLPSGAAGTLTAMGSRATTASDRVGDVTVNGEVIGQLNGATTADTNQITAPFTATPAGTVEVKITPAAGSTYAYLNALAVDFDG